MEMYHILYMKVVGRRGLDARLETSKARRVYLVLRDGIASGDLAVGTRLPSEPELAAAHDVSRVTVRRALDQLEREQLIRRQPGAGTFVLGGGGRKTIVADLANMLAQLVEMGRATRVKLLSFGYMLPPPAVAQALRLAPAERTQRSVRVRYLDSEPFSYLVTHVPERIGLTYSEGDLATTPLLALLERSGVAAEQASQTISATLAGPDVAEALSIDVGAPLLSVTRAVFGPDGQGIEHLTGLYRPDLYSFQMDLMRIGRRGERRWSPVVAQRGDAAKNGRRKRPGNGGVKP